MENEWQYLDIRQTFVVNEIIFHISCGSQMNFPFFYWIIFIFSSIVLFNVSDLTGFKCSEYVQFLFRMIFVRNSQNTLRSSPTETNWLQLVYWCNKIGCVVLHTRLLCIHFRIYLDYFIWQTCKIASSNKSRIETTMCNNTLDQNYLDFSSCIVYIVKLISTILFFGSKFNA